ncbi:MAG: hypothetical protein WBK91_08155 [Alphaproteobacteria bacterium]
MSAVTRAFRTVQACLYARAGMARVAGELVTANALERVRDLAAQVTRHTMKNGSLMYVAPALRKFPLALPAAARNKWGIDLRDAATMLAHVRRRIPCPEGAELDLKIVRPEDHGSHVREPHIVVDFRPRRTPAPAFAPRPRDDIPDLSA